MGQIQSLKRLALDTLPPSWVPPLAARMALLTDERELHLLDLLCRRGTTSVDVGANLGIYTELLRRYSADVVAVEPHPALASRLRRAFPAHVRVVEAALSAAPGRASIRVPVVEGREIDTRGSLEMAANAEFQTFSREVNVLTLDLLELGAVGFIKIDVEGHEHDVVSGGLNLLRASRPRLLIELEERHRAGCVEQMGQQLRRLGYRGFFVSSRELTRIDEFEARRHQPSGRAKAINGGRAAEYVNNFIFLAAEECGTILPRLQQCLERLGAWTKLRHALEF
jgi:FkbM family methyltransferase